MSEPSRNGTNGRVFGGDPELLHIKDGERAQVGSRLADELERIIRDEYNGGDTDTTLCPGCTMIAFYNASVHMAQRQGQSMDELRASMMRAFDRLADPEFTFHEEMDIIAA